MNIDSAYDNLQKPIADWMYVLYNADTENQHFPKAIMEHENPMSYFPVYYYSAAIEKVKQEYGSQVGERESETMVVLLNVNPADHPEIMDAILVLYTLALAERH